MRYTIGNWIEFTYSKSRKLGYIQNIAGSCLTVFVVKEEQSYQVYNNTLNSYEITPSNCELTEEDLRECIDFAIDNDQKALFHAWTEDLKKQKETMEG